jgi:hypothetical protein
MTNLTLQSYTKWCYTATMAKLPIKIKKKTPAQLKKKLWELCKTITRIRYKNKDGTWYCYTCKRLIQEPVGAHTAHFIPSSTCGGYLRYDLRNLRVCCYYCNINLGGNGSAYYKQLVEDEGQDYVDTLFKDKNKIVKLNDHVITLINEYEEILQNL